MKSKTPFLIFIFGLFLFLSPSFAEATIDLVITDIRVYGVGMGISYTIKNQGTENTNIDPDLMYSWLYVDDSYKDDSQDSSLAAGASSDKTFVHYLFACSGSSDTIKVCADGSNVKPESNETNNCLEKTFVCPDLVITDIWLDATTKNIYYTIKNQGGVTTDPVSPYQYLYVNGAYEASWNVNALAAGESATDYIHGWSCPWACSQSHSVEVCADKAGPSGAAASGGGDVVESGESNNCRTETVTCTEACCGNLTLSVSGNVTCTVTPGLCSTCCNGKTWQIREGINNPSGAIKCSGTIINDAFCPVCTGWTVNEGTWGYTLYIDGAPVANNSVTCPGAPNVPPTCDYLSASPATGTAPLNVSFLASGSDSDGTINQYEFDFGDGSPLVYSTTTGVTHTYNAIGAYCAKLRVKDNNGAWSVNTGSCPGGVCTVQIIVAELGSVIVPPSVITNPATNIASTSATLNGNLLNLGYDPGICPNCKTIVWFEWGATGTAGVSGSYGTSTIPTIANTPSPFLAVVSLTPGKTYYFEAFAKNGGSW